MRALLLSFVLLAACGPEPVEPDPIQPVGAGFACDDAAGEPEWSFDVSISGPVDVGRTTVFVETDDVADADGFGMTVAGDNGTTVAFEATVPGTPDGQDPAPGEVPFSCTSADLVTVTFCATPEGRPGERPCWACDPGTGEGPPADIEDWIACD